MHNPLKLYAMKLTYYYDITHLDAEITYIFQIALLCVTCRANEQNEIQQLKEMLQWQMRNIGTVMEDVKVHSILFALFDNIFMSIVMVLLFSADGGIFYHFLIWGTRNTLAVFLR